ncbi:MAG: hypothetical protein HW403_1493 [Dehalococcoidia bacterium]|nr:hypothetical protein [Dehalococcoidia bacterium]
MDPVKRAIARLRASLDTKITPISRLDLSPGSPFEALIEARQRELEREVEEMKGRVNGLIFLVMGTALVQIVIRLLG